MGTLLLPYVAGLVTILNPCILSILPIIVATALGESRHGAAALAAGLVASFSTLGFLLLTVGFSIGLDPGTVRIVGALVLVAAGVTLVAPRVQAAFTSVTEPLVRGGNRVLGRVSGRGAGGQFVIGALLGLVWTPCVGPTLGVAIASASQGKDLVSAFFVFLFFGLGVATALMAIAYGSRRALSGHKATFQAIARWSKPGLGILLILISILIVSGLDRVIEAALVGLMPDWLIGITVGI